uniref:Uncharacterized protein n=1 Tax=Lepeophtheirus salmonis TaxID=72036 RepID=A0A0K2TC59_LEPSM
MCDTVFLSIDTPKWYILNGISVSNWIRATTWGPNFSSWDSFKRATLGFVMRMKSDKVFTLPICHQVLPQRGLTPQSTVQIPDAVVGH